MSLITADIRHTDVPAAAPDAGRTVGRIDVPFGAWIQIAAFFGIALGIDELLAGGDRFAGVQPHPFWIAVVLASVQYGTPAGLVAVLTACAALLVGHLPDQALTEDRFAYLLHVSGLPLMWLAAALVIGEIRSRQLRSTARIGERCARLKAERNTLAAGYRQVKRAKMELELRIAGQTRTAAAICETMAGGGGVALDHAHEIVRSVLAPRKFSFYLLDTDGLRGVSNEGWAEGEPLAGVFDRASGIFRAVVEDGRVLCVARPDDEAILGGQGLLAGPLRHEGNGEILGMLKIEGAGFRDLDLDALGMFQGVCGLIGTALANRQRIADLERARFRSAGSRLLAPGVRPDMIGLMRALGRSVGFPVLEMSVAMPRSVAARPDGPERFAAALQAAVAETCGPAALVFDRQDGEPDYTVLLPHRVREPAFARTANLRQAILKRIAAVDEGRSDAVEIRCRWLEDRNDG